MVWYGIAYKWVCRGSGGASLIR